MIKIFFIPPVFDDISFWPFSEILVIFAINAIMNLKVIPGWNRWGFFLVILHILRSICAEFQLVIIFGWVSVRINRTNIVVPWTIISHWIVNPIWYLLLLFLLLLLPIIIISNIIIYNYNSKYHYYYYHHFVIFSITNIASIIVIFCYQLLLFFWIPIGVTEEGYLSYCIWPSTS